MRVLRIGIGLVLFVAVAGIARLIHVQHLQAASGSFREFTVIRAETSQGRGSYVLNKSLVEAQRSDGSHMTGELQGDDLAHPVRRHVKLVPERISVQINDELRAKTTLYFKNDPAPRPPSPDPQCGISHISGFAKPTFVGEGQFSGFRTVGIKTEETVGDQVYIRTEWRAPDLGCVAVQLHEERQDTSYNKTGHFDMNVIKILSGPPSPELFGVPDGYAEKSPSQMQQAVSQTSGGLVRPMPQHMARRLEKEDERYFANHRQAGVP